MILTWVGRSGEVEEMGEGDGPDGEVPAVEWSARVKRERTWQDRPNKGGAAWKDFVG